MASIADELVALATTTDAITDAVVGAQARIDQPLLVSVTERLSTTASPLSANEEAVVIRVIKELSRTIAKAVSATARDADNINGFIHLDDNLLPLVDFVNSAISALEVTKSQRGVDDLLRWMPFAIYASAFFTCGQLPAYDAMRCYDVANEVIDKCQRLHHQPSREALMGEVVDRVVALISQGIDKEQWVAQYCINRHVMEWVVLQVRFPRLGGDVLGRVLALVFPLVDDLTDSTQIVGASMLLHIVRNVTATELRWFTDVLLEVLKGAITSRKPATLDLFIETLVISLDKVSPPGDFQYYERFLPRMLNDCSLSSDVTLRLLYTRHLRTVVQRLGAPHSIFIIRYLQPLIKVLVASMDSVHKLLVKETLQTLRVTVLCAWPRIPSHLEEIFVAVLRAVSLCEAFPDIRGGTEMNQLPDDHDKQEILEMCDDIMILLSDIDQPRTQTLLKRVASEAKVLEPFASRTLAHIQHLET